ncbi:signal peptidase I [Rhodococcus sp. NPDC057135]|uniref:signal peptidase I n=1 Tax=Rhodococcus sp. NPDC057135 TaxID=3346028 RepID=UPI00362A2428
MSHHNRPDTINRLKQAALTTGAVLGILCIIATALSFAFGIKPVVFRSGSMSPAIPTGSLAFVKSQPVSELSVGDIVSVTTSGGERLTHRVYGIDQLDNNLSSLTLKGDANNAPDSETYAVADADLVVFSMSRVGYVLAWLSGPIGIFAGGLFAGSLLMIAFRPAPRGEGPPNGGTPGEGIPNDTPTTPEHNSPRSRSTQVSSRILTAPWRQRELILVTAAGLGALLTMSPIGNTAALITDTATAKTGQFATVQTFTCENFSPGFLSSGARVTWTAPGAGIYTYRILVLDPDGITYSDNMQSATTVDITLPPALLDLSGSSTVRIYSIENGLTAPSWTGFTLDKGFLLGGTYCGSKISGTSAASRMAASAPTSTQSTVTTTPATTTPTVTTTTGTTEPTPSTSASTTTTTTPTTTTPTTTASTTPETTTTTEITATTTTPPPTDTQVGSDLVSTGRDSYTARKIHSDTGIFLDVYDALGTRIYRTSIESTDVLHWLSGTNQLWIIGTAGAEFVEFTAGAGLRQSAPGDLPAEIEDLVP